MKTMVECGICKESTWVNAKGECLRCGCLITLFPGLHMAPPDSSVQVEIVKEAIRKAHDLLEKLGTGPSPYKFDDMYARKAVQEVNAIAFQNRLRTEETYILMAGQLAVALTEVTARLNQIFMDRGRYPIMNIQP